MSKEMDMFINNEEEQEEQRLKKYIEKRKKYNRIGGILILIGVLGLLIHALLMHFVIDTSTSRLNEVLFDVPFIE